MSDAEERANGASEDSVIQSEPVRTPKESKSVSLVNWAKNRPWLASTLAMFMLAGGATMLGLPVAEGWKFFTTGLLLLGILALVVRGFNWYRRTSQSETGAEERRKLWQGICQFCVIGVIYYMARYHTERDNPRSSFAPLTHPAHSNSPHSVDSSSQLSAIRGTKTSTYWQQTIGALHALRFSDPPDNTDESAAAYYQGFLVEFEQTLHAAQNVSSANVDPDLVTMSQAQLQSDAQLLKMVRGLEEMLMESGHFPSKTTLEEMRSQEDQLWDWLTNLTEEEFADLPEQAQQIVILLVQLIETREQQFREIEIMQARLTERYAGQSFSLPKIVPDAE